MISKSDFQMGIAKMIKGIRTKRGISKAKMADMLFIDERTLGRYEDGSSSPTASELLYYCSVLGVNVLPSILELIYPEVYDGLTNESEISELRRAATHYVSEVASDKTVRELDYLIFGKHGSNFVPQLQMFTMIAHLPMQYRVVVANAVYSMWRLAESRGELVGCEHVMPDVDKFLEGLKNGEKAAFSFSDSYTIEMK